MKNLIRTVLTITVTLFAAQSVLASPGGFDVPDGGSTGLQLAAAVAGLVVVRKFVRR